MNATRVPSTERAEPDAERQPDQLAALEGRALQGVGQVGRRRSCAAISGERAVVAVLDRDLFGDELLLVQHRADADRQDRQAERQAVQRGGQVVARSAPASSVGLVLPRPEQEDQQQRQARKAAQQKPVRHRAFGALLGLGALRRASGLPCRRSRRRRACRRARPVPRATSTPARRRWAAPVRRHGRGVGALAGRSASVVGHDRAPIHRAAPMTATIPMIQAAMPSVVRVRSRRGRSRRDLASSVAVRT